MSEVAKLESEIKEYKLQLEALQPALQADPENEEFASLKTELEELISILEDNLAELKPATAQKEAPEKQKWSREDHSAYQTGYRKPEEEKISFSVNDNVLAKWKSGDKGMHQAKIISITGSSSKPIYTVRFKAGGETETVYTQDLKAFAYENNKKRKADSIPTSSISTATSNPVVISVAANVDANLINQVKSDANKSFDAPKPAKVARKVKANKELEAGKSKWQEFSAKGKFPKAGKKESMFRTGEGVNARVGFVGSGQDMRKDPSRKRHIHQSGGGVDDEA